MNTSFIFIYGGNGAGVALCCILGFVCLFLAVVFVLRRKRRIKALWGALATLIAAGAMLLCLYAPSMGMLIAEPSGDPRETAAGFLDALTGQDWEKAYASMDTYSQLGLENTPESPEAAALAEALRDSYAYTLSGDCVREDLTARQEVRFTYLSLSAVEDAAADRLPEVLSGIVETRPKNQVYDEQNNYLPEVAQEAYMTALTDALAEPEAYYATDTFTLTLEYTGGQWRIQPDQALLRALSGGVV